MRRPKSNPLREELARSQQAGAHPDADVLSAFAEGSLLAREREGVLAHLALCVRCREVLHIAKEAAPEPLAQPQLSGQPKPLAHLGRPPLRGWLPWVAGAACVLVIASAVLLHDHEKSGGKVPSVESARTASPEVAKVPTENSHPPSQIQPKLQPKLQLQLQLQPQLEPRPEPTAALHKAPSPFARRDAAPRSADHSTDVAASTIAPQAGVSSNSRAASGAMAPGAQAAESPESRAEGAAVALKKYPANPDQTESAKTAPPAEVAEAPSGATATAGAALSDAAPASKMRNVIPAGAMRPHWRINDAGQLERSLGDGQWQLVPMAGRAKLHVVAVSGSEVWAGGEKLRLEHSSNNGATWESVKLPAKNGYEHTVTHIRFENPRQGTATSDDGNSWETTDGGRSWK